MLFEVLSESSKLSGYLPSLAAFYDNKKDIIFDEKN